MEKEENSKDQIQLCKEHPLSKKIMNMENMM
jgi:hypothetical protein